MAKLREKIGYGFGDFSSSMFWKIFMYYIMFFYTQVFGLTLEDATLLILVTKMWDAISDPLMGVIADRTSTRWGKYRPYLLWIALPFAVCGVLTFTTPTFGYGGKLVWAYCTYVMMMTVYTAINVPYGAMLGVMSADGKERNIFSSYRMFFAYAGSFVSLMIFGPLCNLFSTNNATSTDGNIQLSTDPAAWQTTMIVIGAICLFFFLMCFFLTRERVKTVASVEQHSSIGRDLKLLVRNAPWWILLGVSLAVVMFNSIRGGVAAYYFSDYIGNDSFMGALFGANIFLTCTIFLTVGEVANMVGVALAVPLAKRLGKKWAYIWSILVVALFTTLFYFIPSTGAMSYWLILLLQVVISVAAGVALPLVWSMFADVADYSEHKNGTGSVGLIFSSSSMAQKFGAAFGSLVIGWLLLSFNYVVPEDAKRYTEGEVKQAREVLMAQDQMPKYEFGVQHDSGAVINITLEKQADGTITESYSTVQSETAIDGLKSLISWIPALAALLGALIMLLYPLGEKRMEGIRAELKLKREIDE